MMKRYYVETMEECPVCVGLGWVRSHAWAAVDAYTDGLTLTGSERDAAIEEFCAEQFGTDNPRHWPLEEVGCGECEGKGEIRRKEDMTDLFVFLLQPANSDGNG